MDLDRLVRQQLIALLQDGNAHMPFEEAVADFPENRINHRPARVDYSFWQLVEHLRLTQRDILDYLTDPGYTAREWPKDYWPASEATTDRAGWDASVAGFLDDRAKLVAMLEDPATDLSATVPSNDDHTILREMLIAADHNAYHVGELGILREVDDAWGPEHNS